MLLSVLLAATSISSAPQTASPEATALLDATPETYQAPVVRPFEPPSDFGREEAQGDASADRLRRPLTQPVAVEAYVGSYEFSPGDGEIAYDQGVTQAEIDADRRAGPLDGRWRVAAPDGQPLLSLSLTDRGEGRRIEGAWRRLDARAASTPGGAAGPAGFDGAAAVVPLAGGELHLRAAAHGWSGELVQNGRARPVTVARPG
ncbi:hypothetical protein SH203_02811 [Brevundimonas sp. SH203]|uniref:hypothetical protein n=1 Tax=Brevundimonas sp. SH203 TaxID=345167 RepID=UPI0009CAEF3F|nr:hypothetical protein [Brevundimonas sp. SH203]GAW42395.1 hypothetical protein SH203_02811 [Brevundimonas sp. SH203]